MALTVQNDTGTQAGADAYVSVATFESYSDNRNRTTVSDGTYSDEAVEAAIRAATQYIDTIGRWKGVQVEDDQSTEFPRTGLTDWSGRTVSGIPQRVKDACCELAFKALSEELYEDLDRGGRVASESVGPISVSYFNDAPAGKTFRAAMKLLEPYMRDKSQLYAGHIGGAAGQSPVADAPTELTEQFGLNMHANNDD